MALVNYPINFNSKDRFNKNDPSYMATFKISDLINVNSRKKTYLSLPYVVIPPTWYNITTQNNKLSVIEDTVPSTVPTTHNITIAPGNYNVNSLIVALSTAMTTGSPYAQTYTGSYDSTTGKLSMSIVGSPPGFTFTYSFAGLNQDLKVFLGFNQTTYDNVTLPFPPVNYLVVSPEPVNFTGSIPSIYVRANIWKNDTCYDTSNGIEGNAGDILLQIPIYGNGLSQIVMDVGFEGIESKRIEIGNIINSFITFTLTSDDSRFFIDLNNNDWQGVLLVQYTLETKR